MASIDELRQARLLILRYVTIRDRSKKELAEYLARKGVDEAVIEQALTDASDMINDHRFAESWIHMRLRQGKGDLVIRFELKQKGVDHDDIDRLLRDISLDTWLESMVKVLDKKGVDTVSESLPEKLVIRKILYQRGFSSFYIDAFLQNKVQ